MRRPVLAMLMAAFMLFGGLRAPAAPVAAATVPPLPDCVAFSPYVNGYDPDFGPHPSPALIDALLDALAIQSTFRCIQVYGVLNGLDHVVVAAQQRGFTVIQILWLDTDADVNNASIQRGIELATQYPSTIVRVSCGSEARTRNGLDFLPPIQDCINRLRAAGVTQPIGTIETWWDWCNREEACHPAALADQVDWIGVNVFPWWENTFSGLFPCTPAAGAAAFAIDRLRDVQARYPTKRVTLTEYGWPAGPHGYTERNVRTGHECGVASEDNQTLVVGETRNRLEASGFDGVMFAAYREGPWKNRVEQAPIGTFWGLCSGTAPYFCKTTLVDCEPLPSRARAVVREGPGRLRVTVSTTAGALRAVQLVDPNQLPSVPVNASIDIPGGPTGVTGPFTYTLPAPARTLTFYLNRAAPGATQVPLVAVDGCAPGWKSFVGGGSATWGP